MADCWAGSMVVTRAGLTAVKTNVKRPGLRAMNLVDYMVGSMANCWAGRMVVTRVGSTTGYTTVKPTVKCAGSSTGNWTDWMVG